MRSVSVLLILALTGCGYRYQNTREQDREITIEIPYIAGDPEGILNRELFYRLSSEGGLVCVSSGGEYLLEVIILSEKKEKIGFRYDRDNVTGKREENILGVEACRSILAKVSLLETTNRKTVLGPYEVEASVDYDYTDPGSPKDLLFHRREAIMPFSLGQLDSEEGAYDDAAVSVFRLLSQKIALGLQDRLLGLQR